MDISNVSIQPLDGGPPISLGDARLTIDRTTIEDTYRHGLSLDMQAQGVLRMHNPLMDMQTFREVFGQPSKESPALDAVVQWDPWRNPAAFWRLMTSLLMKGPGVRWRIRQATRADRLKGGAMA